MGLVWPGCSVYVTIRDTVIVKCCSIECANKCLSNTKITQSRLEMEDRHMKLLIKLSSSIYGISSMQVSQLGAAITAINRTNILAKGQLCVKSYQATILFIDTDSLFISLPDNPSMDLTTLFNNTFPDTTIGRADYREVFFIQKKAKFDKKAEFTD